LIHGLRRIDISTGCLFEFEIGDEMQLESMVWQWAGKGIAGNDEACLLAAKDNKKKKMKTIIK
jgi:hypothetical protein